MQLELQLPGAPARSSHQAEVIGALLAPHGLQAGRIAVVPRQPVAAAPQDLRALHRQFGIRHAERERFGPGDARWPLLRPQRRAWHVHAERELRVLLAGQLLVAVALPDGGLAQLLLDPGDWLAVDAGLPHAWDAGLQAHVDLLHLSPGTDGPGTAVPALPLPAPDLDRWLVLRRHRAVAEAA